MIIAIIAVVFLLILSAFFSGTETAMTGASPAIMHDLEKNGNNRRAQTINRLFRHKDSLIITTLLGSNLSNTLATALSTSILISLFGSEGVAYATIIMTILVLIYTDMLPKSYAVRHADNVALSMAPLIDFSVKLFFPLTYILQKIVNVTFQVFGLNKSENRSKNSSLAEIRGAVYMHPDSEGCQEKEMLKGVLDLSEVTVYDVMNHRRNLFSVDISLPAGEIINKVKDSPFSRIPVYEDKPENIIGIIRVKALLRAAIDCCGNYSELNVREIMYAPWFIPDNTTLLQQLQMFRARREHFAVVVDEYGDLQGIVTLEDILEEIVGDINDECDIMSLDIMGIRKTGGDSYIVDGQVPLRDLNRRFGWNFSDENAVTIAGYLLDATRSIPETGQKFEFGNFRFEIVKRHKNQICQIKITPLPEEKLPADKS
jgi:COG4536: putative mg2+ and co2+ transporter corB